MGTKIIQIKVVLTERLLRYHLDKVIREYVPGGRYSRQPGHWFAARFQQCRNGIPIGPPARWEVFDSEAACDKWIAHQRRRA